MPDADLYGLLLRVHGRRPYPLLLRGFRYETDGEDRAQRSDGSVGSRIFASDGVSLCNVRSACARVGVFDADRDGFVIGEGGGALVFEELEHAVARGAKIYCEVIGGGMSADAHHMTAPHPEGKGAMMAMREALLDAEIAPTDIDYINAHGTSTPLGDIAEIRAIKSLFGEHAYKLNISSTKSMAGHLLGGTAAIEALACVMAITRGVIPPTINVENVDPEIDSALNLTLGEAQSREVRCALSNTFGFGGHNSTIIFRKM